MEAAMQDWATFFFTGSSTLPAFMVLVNDESIGLALFVFLGLLITACLVGLHDPECPARKASLQDMERRDRERERERK
jgi:hypothetical protein